MQQLIGYIQANKRWCFALVTTFIAICLIAWNILLTNSYNKKLNDLQTELHAINMYIRDSPWLECEKKR